MVRPICSAFKLFNSTPVGVIREGSSVLAGSPHSEPELIGDPINGNEGLKNSTTGEKNDNSAMED